MPASWRRCRRSNSVGVADVNFAQAQAVAERLGTLAFADFEPLLHLVDAACIVVPTSQHGVVASEFLKRHIHVLVEKPLALNLREADALVCLAAKNQALLQVGHIERFNPAFQEVQARALQPKFIRAQRLGAYTGRSGDVGVVLDLMIHDIDLVLALVHSPSRRSKLSASAFSASTKTWPTPACGSPTAASPS